MAKNLEDVIRDLKRAGKLNHLTVGITKDGKFQAGFRDSTSAGYWMVTDPDPVTAMLKAIRGEGYNHAVAKAEQSTKKKARDLLG